MTGMPYLVVTLLALAAAAAVALVAHASAPARDERPLRAFRRGLRSWLRRDERQTAREAVAAEPVDVSLDQMLRANVEEGSGYARPDTLTR